MYSATTQNNSFDSFRNVEDSQKLICRTHGRHDLLCARGSFTDARRWRRMSNTDIQVRSRPFGGLDMGLVVGLTYLIVTVREVPSFQLLLAFALTFMLEAVQKVFVRLCNELYLGSNFYLARPSPSRDGSKIKVTCNVPRLPQRKLPVGGMECPFMPVLTVGSIHVTAIQAKTLFPWFQNA